jgi:alkylation response protein AidB-like acyl-CoA dehydrogenase
MNLAFSDDQLALRRAFADLFDAHSTIQRVRAAEPRGFDEALWRLLVATGAPGIGVRAVSGGGGGGLLELALTGYEAGRRLAPAPIAETAAAARLLDRLDADALLASALDGSAIVSIALGPAPLAGQWLVDGAVADVVLSLEGDARVVAVSRPAEVETASNLGSLPLGRWPSAMPGQLIADGPAAVAAFRAALDEVRLLRAAMLVGLTGESISIGAAYARQRTAFGTAIGAYQAVAHPLADALTAHDGAQLLLWKACWTADTAGADTPRLAAMAFSHAADTAYRAAGHSLHIHGGLGFTAESAIQLYYRRAKAWGLVFGDLRRERLLVADRSYGPVQARSEEAG